MSAQEFMTIIGGRLPLEVCENIGGYCLSDYTTRLYAARLFKDAWAKRGHFGSRDAAVHVTKSHEVWAQHIEFEGIQYIKSLSTGRKSGSDTKLFEATDDTRVNIYFAEDPLGIREVVMTRDDNTVLAQGENLSWVINRGVALPFWFKPESDGLKLRDLAITKTKKADANYRQRRWAALPNHLRVCQLAQPPVYSGEMSKEPIRLVDWNLPGCRGYTVLIDMNSVCAIIPNSTRLPSSQLADAASRRALVSEGRVPQGNSLFAKYKNLIIRTNKGRSFVLGSGIESRSTRKDVCKFTYQGIAALSLTQPTRMLYMAKPPRFWLCVDPAESLTQRRINLSLPKPSKPTAYRGKQFFSSTAELRDVRTIAACQGWRCAVGVEIVGLLLTYVDGHQRCIGQIRLGHMDAPLTVTSGKIWLGADKSEQGPLPGGFWPRTKKIKWVGVEKPLPNENREYLEVSLEGSLKWQSHKNLDYYAHTVYHVESSELQDTVDEMEEVLAHETASGELAPRW
ncbi:uncharacterized protein FFUJ_00338 [Fusarium fujikuroi IMI 58289]|uniref:Uncharacterized protein n=1 Tax=Gibberella fujikuroi (strain CBS 195.34 / IMI 58289 / NRRL A-6831) TaxID=1279085 RepID=S0DNU4_GIBF5|nr:uncharacterized protein FFUJ_00338 [Fusarium fujikuroi IMI 58289]KLP16105.1 uncharacterized protein LW94_6531 [Fusarium fujikuroi]CCT63052.1 uncharacterized protein FFUJ_00338 [Fusarium fujikuroi IMI 58289]SCN72223.1 uncharacterized protein FFM5_00350 [Fusarium fujikuroi]SCO30523.1 uncharacterized protein FFMR_01842 [Fusarium fujikuroi]